MNKLHPYFIQSLHEHLLLFPPSSFPTTEKNPVFFHLWSPESVGDLFKNTQLKQQAHPSHKFKNPNSRAPAFPSFPWDHLPEAFDSDINVLSLPYLSIMLSDAVHATLTH